MKADNNMVLVSGLDEHKSDLVLDAASFGVWRVFEGVGWNRRSLWLAADYHYKRLIDPSRRSRPSPTKEVTKGWHHF